MGNIIRFDWALKRLLRQKANFVILEGFLSELLQDDIKIQEVLESESNRLDWDNKCNRVDLLCRNKKDEIIIIEIQNDPELDYFHRILFGVSKTIAEHMKKGSPYENIKKIHSVNLVFFGLGVGEDYIYHGTTNFKGIHKGDVLKLTEAQREKFDIASIYEIYPEYWILKVNQFNDVAKSSFDEWMYCLKNEELPANAKAKGLKEAAETLDIMKLSKDDRLLYDSFLNDLHYLASMHNSTWGEGHRKGIKKGIKRGREEGRQEGEKNKALEIARNLLKKGLTPKEAAEMTGLSEEEIQKLREE
jgi:predicted transposase/invertase (TIGR01784 family)